MKNLEQHSFEFGFPKSDPPQWKDTVQRWYQLDPYAYGLAEGAYQWRRLKRPDLIILASPTASNETDWAFMKSGADSPTKFAHTLPNIRCSPFCQVMEWSGPVLCVQRDPQTQVHGLIEGFELAESQFKRIWILSVMKHEIHYKVHCFEISESESLMTIKKNMGVASLEVLDKDFMKWFEDPSLKKLSFGNYEINREERI